MRSQTLPAGSVQVRIPKNLGPDYRMALDTSRLNLPEYPATGDSTIFSYIYDSENSCYILTNPLPINGGAAFSVEFYYTNRTTGLYGGDIVNGQFVPGKTGWTESEFNVDFDINIDENNQTHSEETFTYEYHSTDYLSDLSKLSGTGYYEWPSRWGSKPLDSDLYVYVEWHTSAHIGGSQGGSFSSYIANSDMQGEIIGTSSSQSGTAYDITIRARYPKDLVDYNSGRAEVHDTIGVIFSPISARNDSDTTSGTARITWPTYPQAEVQFYVGSTGARVLEGKQTPYVLNNTPITSGLTWQMGYKGDALIGSTQDSFGDTTKFWEPETLVFNTGVGDLYYSSGAGSKYNQWIPPTGNVQLNENDYEIDYIQIRQDLYTAEFYNDPNETYGKKMRKTYISYADGLDYEIYIRRAGESSLTHFKTYRCTKDSGSLTDSWDIGYFPANVVEVEVRVNTKGYYYWDIAVVPTYTLKNTAHIKSLMLEDYNQEASSVLKFGASFTRTLYTGESVSTQATPETFGAETNALLDLHEITRIVHGSISLALDEVVSDITTNNNKGTETAIFTFQAQNHSTTSVEYLPLTKGTFYIMIPYGCEYSIDGVYTKSTNSGAVSGYDSNAHSTRMYRATTSANSQNTGYTLLTVYFDDPDCIDNTVYVRVNVIRRFRDILANGADTYIPYIFVSDADDRPEYTGWSVWGTSDSEKYTPLFTNIMNANAEYDIAQSEAYKYYEVPSYQDWGYRGTAANSSGNYTTHIEVYPGEDYSYWLSYAQSPDAKAKNLRLQDTMDGSILKVKYGIVQLTQ